MIDNYQKYTIFTRVCDGERNLKVLADYLDLSVHINVCELGKIEMMPPGELMKFLEGLEND